MRNCSGVGGLWKGARGLGGAGWRGVPRGQFIVAEEASTGRSRKLNMAINGCLCKNVSGSVRQFKAILLGYNSLNGLLVTPSTIFVLTPE